MVKHTVLTLLIERLREKDKPFCVLDTHAGTGLYDLHDPRAQKTGEAESGILRFLQAPVLPELAGYYSVLQTFNPDWNPGEPATSASFHNYPGSPLFTAKLLRPHDRLIACELHDEDAQTLKKRTHVFANTHVHHRDGYEALQALLPPVEKRGVIVIDPPYEISDEFDRLVSAVKLIHTRWPQGMALIWYPIKDRPALWRFHEALTATGIPDQLCAEFIYEEETRHDRLNGCGFILVNPPWQFDAKLQELFPTLHKALQTPHHGATVTWLVEKH